MINTWNEIIKLVQDTINDDEISENNKRIVLNQNINFLKAYLTETEHEIIRNTIKVCTDIYPFIFSQSCRYPKDMNEIYITFKQIKNLIIEFIKSSNDCIKINSLKFLSVIIQVQTAGDPSSKNTSKSNISLELCPANHPYLDQEQLALESKQYFDLFTHLLLSENVSNTIITAIMNILTLLARTRKQYLSSVINNLLSWKKLYTKQLSPTQLRSIERTIKICFLSIYRLPPPQHQIRQITEYLQLAGVKNSDLKSRLAGTGMKRPSSNSTEENTKRPKTDSDTISQQNVITNKQQQQNQQIYFDFSSLPTGFIIDVVLATLATVPNEKWNTSILSCKKPENTQPIYSLKDPRLRDKKTLTDKRFASFLAYQQSNQQKDNSIYNNNSQVSSQFQTPSTNSIQTNAPNSVTSKTQKLNQLTSMAPVTPVSVINTNDISGIGTPTFNVKPSVVTTNQNNELISKGNTNANIGTTNSNIIVNTNSNINSTLINSHIKAEMKSTKEREEIKPQHVSEVYTTATLQNPKAFSQKEIINIIADAIKRICNSESWIIKGRSSNSARQGWMLMLSKLMNQFSVRTTVMEYTNEINDEIKDVENVKNIDNNMKLTKFNTIIKEPKVDIEDKKDIPILLVKDTFTNELEETIKQNLCDFILENFKLRHELAVLWLHEEWYTDDKKRQAILRKAGKKKVKLPPRQYEKWLKIILDGLYDALEPKDRLFTRFLLDIPEIPQSVINDIIKKYCDDPERMQVGIYTLRDLVILRKANKNECLNLLLSYGINSDKATRSTAIITLKRWITDTDISDVIEKYALNVINELLKPCQENNISNEKPSEEKESKIDSEKEKVKKIEKKVKLETNEKGNSMDVDSDSTKEENKNVKKEKEKENVKSHQWKEIDIIRHLELYFALCSKKHELLHGIFDLYPKLKDNIQRVVRIQIQPLIKSIGLQSKKLLEVIKNFKPGADALAIRVLYILTEKCMVTTPELVEMVKNMFETRDLNPRFLVPIFGALTKSEVPEYLPKIIQILNDTETQRKHVKDVILQIVDPASRNPQTTQKPIMTPQELLVLLHNIEGTVGLKRCSEATQICFSLPQIFQQKVLAVILTQLVEQQPIPQLFMRTTIQTINLYRNLTKFICTNILTQLIVKKVWTMPRLWEGFIRCLKITLPHSLNVVLQLPIPQLKEVLVKVPDLKDPLKSQIKLLPSNQQTNKIEKIMNFINIMDEKKKSAMNTKK